jgi:MFS family permease
MRCTPAATAFSEANMRAMLSASGTLLLSVFIQVCGSGLMFGILPLRAEAEGFSRTMIGGIGAGFFFGMLVGCLIAPALIRHAGHVRAYTAAAAIITATPLAHAMFVDPYAWIGLRFISGISGAVIFATIESWLNQQSSNENRGTVLATYNVINFAAMAIGQQMMRLYDIDSFELFSVGAVLVVLSVLPVALTRVTPPPLPETVTVRLRFVYSISPLAMVGCFCVGLTNSSFWSLTPAFVTDLGLGPGGVANFFSAAILGAVVALFPIGKLSDIFDRRLVMSAASIGTVTASLALVYVAIDGRADPNTLYALSFAWGATAMPIYALACAHGNDFADPKDMVEVATALLLTYTFGASIGPVIAGQIMAVFGSGSLFVWAAIAHLLLVLWSGYRSTQRAAIPAVDRDPFVAVTRTSPVVSELNPVIPTGEEADVEFGPDDGEWDIWESWRDDEGDDKAVQG